MWLSEEGSTTFTYARILTGTGKQFLKKRWRERKKKEESSMSILGDWENDVVFRIKTRWRESR